MPRIHRDDPDRSSAAHHDELGVEDVVERLDRHFSNDGRVKPLLEGAGRRVGRYSLEGVVGQGAFGVVYLAEDPQLNRRVALKIPRPDVLMDSQKRHRFKTEAAAAASLDHPFIVPLLEAELDGPIPFIASAYCPGSDLGQWLQRYGLARDWRSVVNFVAQLAGAVHYAHQQGVIHRDIKPGNIMLTLKDEASGIELLQDFTPRLTDFGLARLAEAQAADTRSSVFVGTPLYMAPEQLDRSQSGGDPTAIDVYALGCVLFELLTGRAPIEGETYVELVDRVRATPPERLHKLRSNVPRDLDTICAKCLQKHPDDRYASASALAADLKRVGAGESIDARPVSVLTRLRRWCAKPERIRQGGLYSVLFNLFTIAWLLFFAVSTAVVMDVLPEDVRAYLFRHTFLAISLFLMPKTLIGWKASQGALWAIYVGACAAAGHALFATASGLGWMESYEAVSRGNPAMRWVGHSFIILGGSFEFLLYLLALHAKRRQAVSL